MPNYFKALLFSMSATVILTANVQAEELDLYGMRASITLYSKVKLGDKAQKSFAGFRRNKKGYYGAFAYSKNNGFSRTTGHNNLKTAREFALKFCNSYVKSGGEKCKIIAVLTPRRYENKNKMTLSRLATKALKELKFSEGYKAFATNDAGYFYNTWGYKSQQEASSRAVRLCNAGVRNKTASIQKRYPCRIIYEHQ